MNRKAFLASLVAMAAVPFIKAEPKPIPQDLSPKPLLLKFVVDGDKLKAVIEDYEKRAPRRSLVEITTKESEYISYMEPNMPSNWR